MKRFQRILWSSLGPFALALWLPACTSSPTPPTPPATTFTLSGVVTDLTSASGLANALVQILDGPSAGKSSGTDASGKYSISGVAAGTMNVSFSAPSYQTATNSVAVSAATVVNVILSKVQTLFTLSGLITDGTSGGILPNIDVLIVNGPNAGKTVKSDNTGHYSIAGLITGTLNVQFSAVSYQTISNTVVASGDVTLNIVLPRVPPSAATVTFVIDHGTCGFSPSDPIVDVFVDALTGTIYNVTTPGSSFTFSVSVGAHILRVAGGGKTNNFGPTSMSVPATGLTVTITCHP